MKKSVTKYYNNPNQLEFQFETRVLRNKAGQPPNESGVYARSTPQFEMSCNKNPNFDYLRIWVMELENGTWIWAQDLNLPNSGTSSPLSTHRVYSTRSTAVLAAFQAVHSMLQRKEGSTKGERVRLRLLKSLQSWMVTSNG